MTNNRADLRGYDHHLAAAGAYDYPSSPADIQAYDIRTGALKWVFHVVPRVGEFGSETWPEKDREKFGGVHNWSESTIDPELGIAFIPTGTARYDFYGGNREGDNLFANSIVALDVRSGERLWHFQTIHHDLWDFDLPVAPKLMTITKDGKKIPIVVRRARPGSLLVRPPHRRAVWPIEERPVPASDVPGEHASPTQPIPTWPSRSRASDSTRRTSTPSPRGQGKARQLLREIRNEGPFPPRACALDLDCPATTAAPTGQRRGDPENHACRCQPRAPALIKLNELPNPEAAGRARAHANAQEDTYRTPRRELPAAVERHGAMNPPFSFLTAYT